MRGEDIGLEGDSHFKPLSNGFHDLELSMSGVDLFAQTNKTKFAQFVHVTGDGASVPAKFKSEGGDAQGLVADELAETDSLRAEALEKMKRIGERDDLFGFEPFPLFPAAGAVQRAAYVAFKSVGQYLNFHNSS